MIAGLRTYPETRGSGVPWFGKLPKNWRIRRLRNVCDIRVSNVDKHSRDHEEPVRLCNYVDVYKNDHIRSGMAFMRATATKEEIARFRLQPGDVLVTKDSEAWTDIGVPALVRQSDDDIICGYHLALLRPSPEVLEGGYLFRLLQSQCVAYHFHVAAKGVTRYGLSHGAIKSMRLLLPPVVEQIGMVRFLDHVDRKIQRYIRAKQKLIALLEEQKQASIRQAITGQIDVRTGKPYPSYAESGVDWLGRVPEHWEIRRLGTSVERCINGTWGSEPNGADDLVCVRVADFDRVRWRVKLDKPTFRAVAPGERRNRLLREGDLLLEKSGGGDSQPVGVVVLYDHDIDAVCSNFVARVPVSSRCDAAYLVYLHAHLYSTRLNTRSIKQTTGIQNLDASMYFSEKVAFPPLVEQIAIARSLDEVAIRSDSARGGTRSEIDRLSEYRARLISDVVTGQLDVREAAVTLSDVEPLTAEDEPGPTLNADDKALVEEEGTLPGVAKQ